VLPAERLVDYFGPESFDVVVSTEVVEHVLDWRLVINNMKVVLRRGGFIYLTTRSRAFHTMHTHMITGVMNLVIWLGYSGISR